MKQKRSAGGIAELLRGIGEAPPVAFAPAPFQVEALRALVDGDVLVSAPTGSGKTWIAEQEIARVLQGTRAADTASPSGRIWYTAPLKALSNQKFRRFQGLYGDQEVGLLTGERRVNPQAPVIVATTEILRNSFYDSRPDHRPPDVIVLDEAHYLADPERGTAWEEILLLAAPETRLLLLSATIPNAREIAAWLGEVRGSRPAVITLETRPVPLQFLLADGAGRLLPPDPGAVSSTGRHLRWLRFAADGLESRRLIPAIVFFPSRRECDDAARQLGSNPAPDEGRRAERLREWIAQVPQLARHPLLSALRRGGVAPHHAGHLTAWRMCVEDLLEAGLVRLVCATTTLAAGLDVPARTVLLSTLYRNSPAGPEALTPTEFHQMTGRAGRRGRDTLGVAVIAVETSAEAEEGMALAAAAPDPVVSAFMPSDAQVLNLLARAPLRDAEALLGRSLAAFQRRPEIAAVGARLAALPADPLTTRPCGDRLATRSRFEHLLRELRRARRGTEGAQAEIPQLGRAILEMPCTGCPVVERCLASLRDLRAIEHSRRLLGAELAELEEREIRVFHRRAGILRALGYLDEGWRLTGHGRVAARIRHPRMLIIAEAMRARIFPSDPSALAAVAGALGSERAGPPTPPRPGRRSLSRSGRRADPLSPGPRLDPALHEARSALVALRDIVIAINGRRRRAGLPEDPLEAEFTPAGGGPAAVDQRAAVVGAWAAGGEWETITARHRIPEGDLQRLIWQAAEILAQFEDLPGGPLPALAGAARRTMLRTPVL